MNRSWGTDIACQCKHSISIFFLFLRVHTSGRACVVTCKEGFFTLISHRFCIFTAFLKLEMTICVIHHNCYLNGTKPDFTQRPNSYAELENAHNRAAHLDLHETRNTLPQFLPKSWNTLIQGHCNQWPMHWRAGQDIPQAGSYHATCVDGCRRSPRPKSKCHSVCNTCRTIPAAPKSFNQIFFRAAEILKEVRVWYKVRVLNVPPPLNILSFMNGWMFQQIWNVGPWMRGFHSILGKKLYNVFVKI